MKPILIHVHVYYPELWGEVCEYLRSLACMPYECVVTVPEGREDILSELKGDSRISRIVEVENRGYDIAPFVQVINGVDLGRYRYVIKLHTKRDMPGDVFLKPLPFNYGYDYWRRYLLSFCSEEHFPRVLKAFERRPELGMVADYRLIQRRPERRFLQAEESLLKRAGLEYKRYEYVMGSMFICRAELLNPLQRMNLSAAEFPLADAAHSENLAHEMERFFGLSVISQGYRIEDVFTASWKQSGVMRALRHLGQFLFFRKRGIDGRCVVKICKIPVYHRRARS